MWLSLAVPLALVALVCAVAPLFGSGLRLQLQAALVVTAIVVAQGVFSGNSGVISFGHISFVALGAFGAGIMSLATTQKTAVFPELFPIIRDHRFGNITSLLLAAPLAAVFAAIIGPALVRLSGLAAGIATFAVLGIVRNVLRNWTKIGPGAKAIPGVPTKGIVQAGFGLAVVVVVAWIYLHSAPGRRLRASREDEAAAAVGNRMQHERYLARSAQRRSASQLVACSCECSTTNLMCSNRASLCASV